MINYNLNTSLIFGFINDDLAVWLILTVVFLIIEACTASLTTIWFAISSAVTAVLAACNVDIGLQTIAFVLLSVILLILTRPLIQKFNARKSATNKDKLVGMCSYVTEKIDNLSQSGYVKINDVYWSARSTDNTVIDVGALVEIKEIRGNKLIVSVKNNIN